MKTFTMRWVATVTCETEIEAESREAAIELFNEGEFREFKEIDSQYDELIAVYETPEAEP